MRYKLEQITEQPTLNNNSNANTRINNGVATPWLTVEETRGEKKFTKLLDFKWWTIRKNNKSYKSEVISPSVCIIIFDFINKKVKTNIYL